MHLREKVFYCKVYEPYNKKVYHRVCQSKGKHFFLPVDHIRSSRPFGSVLFQCLPGVVAVSACYFATHLLTLPSKLKVSICLLQDRDECLEIADLCGGQQKCLNTPGALNCFNYLNIFVMSVLLHLPHNLCIIYYHK